MAASHQSELERATARPDAKSLERLVALHRAWSALDAEQAQSFYDKHEVELRELFEMEADPDKGLAYISLASAACDERDFLGLVAALCLEDVLRQPHSEIVDRARAEAQRSDRFRWMIGGVHAHAISTTAREQLLPLALSPSEPLPLNPVPEVP